jgi:hypothetical protein
VTQTITILQDPQTITFTSSVPNDATVGGPTYHVSAVAPGGPVTFSTTSDACAVDGSTVSFTAAGSCVVLADQPGSLDYLKADQQKQTFDVSAAPDFDLKVEAKPVLDSTGNPQRIDVTVSGLPDTGTATLVATGPDDLHTIGNGTKCPCTVHGPSETVTFTYNTKQSPTATLVFSVFTTDSPDPNTDNDTVELSFPMAAPPRTFEKRLQR